MRASRGPRAPIFRVAQQENAAANIEIAEPGADLGVGAHFGRFPGKHHRQFRDGIPKRPAGSGGCKNAQFEKQKALASAQSLIKRSIPEIVGYKSTVGRQRLNLASLSLHTRAGAATRREGYYLCGQCGACLRLDRRL